MPYCPKCGSPVEQLPDAEAAAVDREIRLAEIAKEQAVEVARIQARTERDYNDTREIVAETEAEAAVDVAEAEAAGMAAAAGVLAETDAEPEPDPVVTEVEPLPEPEPDMAPPVAEEHHDSGGHKRRGGNIFGF